jgi:plasmid stabilization system protein ParE
MAACKITWTRQAKSDMQAILQFYTERNKCSTYSRKLYGRIRRELMLLKKHPTIGVKADRENIRGLIIDGFIIFYKYTPPREVSIELIWNCRQNPDDLKIK